MPKVIPSPSGTSLIVMEDDEHREFIKLVVVGQYVFDFKATDEPVQLFLGFINDYEMLVADRYVKSVRVLSWSNESHPKTTHYISLSGLISDSIYITQVSKLPNSIYDGSDFAVVFTYCTTPYDLFGGTSSDDEDSAPRAEKVLLVVQRNNQTYSQIVSRFAESKVSFQVVRDKLLFAKDNEISVYDLNYATDGTLFHRCIFHKKIVGPPLIHYGIRIDPNNGRYLVYPYEITYDSKIFFGIVDLHSERLNEVRIADCFVLDACVNMHFSSHSVSFLRGTNMSYNLRTGKLSTNKLGSKICSAHLNLTWTNRHYIVDTDPDDEEEDEVRASVVNIHWSHEQAWYPHWIGWRTKFHVEELSSSGGAPFLQIRKSRSTRTLTLKEDYRVEVRTRGTDFAARARLWIVQ